jgi:nucleolar protein 56
MGATVVVHVAESVLGVFAFDDKGRMLASKQFPRDAIEVAGRLASVQMGTPTEEHRKLITKLVEEGFREFTLESELLVEKLREEFRRVKFKVQLPNRAGELLRSKLNEIAKGVGFEEADKLGREVNFILTRQKLRVEAAERDKLVIQAISVLNELDKFTNILSSLIREWYSIHFPELNRLVPEHQTYLKLVLELGPRNKFNPEAMKGAVELPDEDVARIADAAESSLGAPFDELDVKILQDCAREVFALYKVRERVAEHIDELMAQVAPNLRAVVGGSIGARLISLAGGLEELARQPASTLQVLGAEKALFRSLRGRAKPPKHGVIYQYPEVRGAPRRQRGKIARALAGKLSIAARVDAMSGEFVGDKLAADLKARIADIKARYKEPRK